MGILASDSLIQVYLQVAGLAVIYEVQRNSRAEELRKQEQEVLLNSLSSNKLAS